MNVNLKLDTQVMRISIGSRLIVACITLCNLHRCCVFGTGHITQKSRPVLRWSDN